MENFSEQLVALLDNRDATFRTLTNLHDLMISDHPHLISIDDADSKTLDRYNTLLAQLQTLDLQLSYVHLKLSPHLSYVDASWLSKLQSPANASFYVVVGTSLDPTPKPSTSTTTNAVHNTRCKTWLLVPITPEKHSSRSRATPCLESFSTLVPSPLRSSS
jgi:hypothetical protein